MRYFPSIEGLLPFSFYQSSRGLHTIWNASTILTLANLIAVYTQQTWTFRIGIMPTKVIGTLSYRLKDLMTLITLYMIQLWYSWNSTIVKVYGFLLLYMHTNVFMILLKKNLPKSPWNTVTEYLPFLLNKWKVIKI